MHQEAERQDRDHDGNDRRGHEVAAELEQAVALAEEIRVGRGNAELAREGIDHGEEVDRRVQKEEDNQEGSTHRLDEFLADRGVEYKHRVWI